MESSVKSQEGGKRKTLVMFRDEKKMYVVINKHQQ